MDAPDGHGGNAEEGKDEAEEKDVADQQTDEASGKPSAAGSLRLEERVRLMQLAHHLVAGSACDELSAAMYIGANRPGWPDVEAALLQSLQNRTLLSLPTAARGDGDSLAKFVSGELPQARKKDRASLLAAIIKLRHPNREWRIPLEGNFLIATTCIAMNLRLTTVLQQLAWMISHRRITNRNNHPKTLLSCRTWTTSPFRSTRQ